MVKGFTTIFSKSMLIVERYQLQLQIEDLDTTDHEYLNGLSLHTLDDSFRIHATVERFVLYAPCQVYVFVEARRALAIVYYKESFDCLILLFALVTLYV